MSKEISNFANQSFRISDDIVSRKNSDGTVIIMKMEDGDIFYKMNGIAASVYKEMETGKSLVDVCNNILKEYNVSEEVLVNDVQNLLSELSKAGILA